MKSLLRGVGLFCLMLGCPVLAGAADESLSGRILLLAAASTADVIEELRAQFGKLHPQVTVRTSFAASSTLAQQISAGADADLFLSASSQWADILDKKMLVATRRDLLGNRLVVVVPVDSKLALTKPDDLLKAEIKRLALADPQAVPAGIYAKQALEKLKLWEQLKPRVAGAADVRQALKFVATGAAEAGIVYATDAAAEKKVRTTFNFDADLTEPIRYPLVLIKRAEKNLAAVAFYEFLGSAAAAKTFRKHGFSVIEAMQPASLKGTP